MHRYHPSPAFRRLAMPLVVALVVAAGPGATMGAELEALLAKHDLTGAHVGFHVIDQNDGATLTTRNTDRGFIPASTVKMLTAVAGLGVLGPDHRFRTSLHATGDVQDGTLTGDLYLRGAGDPLLAAQDLMGLAGRLRDLGVTRVAGRFLYDESIFPRIAANAADQPDAAPYNAGLSALSFDFNRIRAHWETDGNGTTKAYVSPFPGSATIDIDDRADRPGEPFAPDPDAGADAWTLSPGDLTQAQGAVELPVRDPGRRTAQVFRILAQVHGIAMPPPAAGAVPKTARDLAAHDSPPLTRILRPALEYSNNMVSELIGLAAARKLAGRPETLAASSRRLVHWIADQVPALDIAGLRLPNHSGLSVTARATPRQMVVILRHALKARYAARSLLEMLPAGGWRDSLSGRFRDPGVAGRVWAKSGTLHYATGLVGTILRSKEGRPLIFALYITDDKRRNAYDADPDRQTAAVQAKAKAWIERAKAFEEDLVSLWITTY